jgi:hypothetical protein
LFIDDCGPMEDKPALVADQSWQHMIEYQMPNDLAGDARERCDLDRSFILSKLDLQDSGELKERAAFLVSH